MIVPATLNDWTLPARGNDRILIQATANHILVPPPYKPANGKPTGRNDNSQDGQTRNAKWKHRRTQPGRSQIAEAVDYRFDYVLGLVLALLVHHREQHVAAWFGDGVFAEAAYHLDTAQHQQYRREGQ